MTSDEKFVELATAIRVLAHYADLGYGRDKEVQAELREIRNAMQRVAEECQITATPITPTQKPIAHSTEVFPGDRIGDAGCPICGAGLRIEHGDEEGQIAVLADDQLTTPGTLAYAEILLKEWRNTPFFGNREEWERWVADFGARVDEVLRR